MSTIGTRTSNLARWQTDHVITQLRESWPQETLETRPFVTQGDKTLDKPLPEIGGKGLFTAELEQALLTGEIDMAVHSLKDLPTTNPDGLIVGAVLARADARDVLLAREPYRLGSLPQGATVGTSSLRRKAQLLLNRPDLNVQPIRGNVETRIQKMLDGQYEAIVLAAAGVERLGLTAHVQQYLPLNIMMCAPGQGAIAVQCRADDAETRELLKTIHHVETAVCVHAERTFLNRLGGGCATPVAAYAVRTRQNRIQMSAIVASVDGKDEIMVRGEGNHPHELGQRLALDALNKGARALLEAT